MAANEQADGRDASSHSNEPAPSTRWWIDFAATVIDGRERASAQEHCDVCGRGRRGRAGGQLSTAPELVSSTPQIGLPAVSVALAPLCTPNVTFSPAFTWVSDQ